MSETLNPGKRRASVPVDSGVASGGRHRLDAEATPEPPDLGLEAGSSRRGRSRWFRRG